MAGKITISSLRERKANGEQIVSLTAWDFVSASVADQAGADLILVGDSLAMTIRGDEDTLSITLDDMIYHAKMARRGCGRALVVLDMPFLTYQLHPAQALMNAGRALREAGVQAVKMEGGSHMAETVEFVTRAGIPVMAHIGLTPQAVHQLGGFKAQGKSVRQAQELVVDARALEAAGAFAIVLECVPEELAKHISENTQIPTIGIGAGRYCDGQIQVSADLLGFSSGNPPKHAGRYMDFHGQSLQAIKRYIEEVKERRFPVAENVIKASAELTAAIADNELI